MLKRFIEYIAATHIPLSRLLAAACLALAALHCSADELVVAVARLPFSLPLFVADTEGYFAAEGLKIRFLDCLPGRRCLKHMLDGEAQLATVADTPVVFASFSRTDFVILATFSTSANDAKFVTRKSAGINAPRDLAGKRIGVVTGTSGHYFLDSFLLFHGVDPSGVKLIPRQAEDIVAAMEKHEVDAVAAFEPSPYQAVKSLGTDAIVLRGARIYTTTFNLLADRRLLGGRDADLVKLLRAIERAERFIHDEPKKAQAILQVRLKLDQGLIDWIWPDYDFALSLDQSLITSLESEARWAMREGHATGKRPANYLDYLYTTPLLKVLPGAVTVVK